MLPHKARCCNPAAAASGFREGPVRRAPSGARGGALPPRPAPSPGFGTRTSPRGQSRRPAWPDWKRPEAGGGGTRRGSEQPSLAGPFREPRPSFPAKPESAARLQSGRPNSSCRAGAGRRVEKATGGFWELKSIQREVAKFEKLSPEKREAEAGASPGEERAVPGSVSSSSSRIPVRGGRQLLGGRGGLASSGDHRGRPCKILQKGSGAFSRMRSLSAAQRSQNADIPQQRNPGRGGHRDPAVSEKKPRPSSKERPEYISQAIGQKLSNRKAGESANQ
ncbi:uncharacterized protein LOC113426465 [Notechis scutatus]|uniref:Uncharacterized protein LOC113426465 n=1 Tax=Notechis scutatus TaxID=8663 RepID=A0A6J1VNI0_9SAUR|nr:uncharacterized protein LOC113426465 [Notechis scutatus]